jgi:hypothetical protein
LWPSIDRYWVGLDRSVDLGGRSSSRVLFMYILYRVPSTSRTHTCTVGYLGVATPALLQSFDNKHTFSQKLEHLQQLHQITPALY